MVSCVFIDTNDNYLNNNHFYKKNININYNKLSRIIENINDSNYEIKENEIKYEIFDNNNNIQLYKDNIELIIYLPNNYIILSINKIKLSNNLEKYIDNISIYGNNEKIYNYETDNFNKKIDFCKNYKNITINIKLQKSVMNKILNKSIFINYSYLFNKKKIKFVYT